MLNTKMGSTRVEGTCQEFSLGITAYKLLFPLFQGSPSFIMGDVAVSPLQFDLLVGLTFNLVPFGCQMAGCGINEEEAVARVMWNHSTTASP